MAEALSPAQKGRLRAEGYLLLRGLVPEALCRRAARAAAALSSGRSAAGAYDDRDYWSGDSDSPSVLALYSSSPLRALCESLLGPDGAVPPGRAQLALRLPQGRRAHGAPVFHVDELCSPAAARQDRSPHAFALLAGVLLSDVPRPFMGNFTVCPGSHLRLARFIRRRGTAPLASGLAGKIGLEPAVQVTGRRGDVVLCHFLLAHDKEQNLSRRARAMAFFRVPHRRHAELGRRALVKPWLEWPGLRA